MSPAGTGKSLPDPVRVPEATPDAEALLAELLARIRTCRLCRDRPRGKALPHEPRPVVIASRRARILIAGQAPGLRVQESGVPFDDPSGKRLREWLGVDVATFYHPDNFAIVPMGFCFPGADSHGSDLPPRTECAPAWRQELLDAMPQIELILAIGQHAQAWHLGASRRKGMSETVRDWRRILAERPGGRMVLPLPHPSWRNSGWLRRNPWFAAELLPELRREVAKRITR